MGNDDHSKIMLGENDNKQPTSSSNEFCDFVMVDADEDGSEYMTDDDDDDDESYDYCEDACSMLSNNSTSRHHHQDLTGSLVCMKDSILTVPDVLMRDLDEAHAAARLVQFHDDTIEDSKVPGSSREPRSSDHYSSASSVVSMEDESSSSPPTEQMAESTCLEDSSKTNTSVEPKEPAKTKAKPAQKEIKVHTFSIGVSTKKDESTNSKGTGSMSGMSRTSNKKRRKKLKMLKKAQAAANAAQQLAEKAQEAETTETTEPGTSSKQLVQEQQKAKLRSSNTKKVTNIAVACATETMAAYRNELLSRGIK